MSSNLQEVNMLDPAKVKSDVFQLLEVESVNIRAKLFESVATISVALTSLTMFPLLSKTAAGSSNSTRLQEKAKTIANKQNEPLNLKLFIFSILKLKQS